MRKFIVMLLIIIAAFKVNAQNSAKYYVGNSGVSQNLSVKWLSTKKVNFTYTIKEKNKAGKLITTTYKGVATSLGGDGETDEDVDGAYDVDEFSYKLKSCTVYLRIASDKSKATVKSGGCPSAIKVSSIDKMVKL